jgi:thymidylate kinase
MKKIYIIEGIDGCGKDSVKDFMVDLLGDNVSAFREPDGHFRKILKESVGKLSMMDEYMTMWIGRFVLWLNEIISDKTKEHVIINRSFPSTYAYQIEGRGLEEYRESFFFWKNQLLSIVKDSGVQVHHVYLRTSVKVSLERIGNRGGGELEHFEEETFLRKTKGGYDLFYGDKSNFSSNEIVHVIDANQSKSEVFASVRISLNM